MIDHDEQLKDPRWERLRMVLTNHVNSTCQVCKRKKRSLQIHHKLYIEGKNLWDYPNRFLIVMCSDCHQEWHTKHNYLTVKEDELYKHMIPCPHCAKERKLKRYINCKYCDGTGKVYERDLTDYKYAHKPTESFFS